MSVPRVLRGLLVCLLLMKSAEHSHASDTATRLSFLLNFGRFTEWSPLVLPAGVPVRYCFAPGDAELARDSASLEGQHIQGRAIKAITINRPSEVAGCQVLFLPTDLSTPLAPFLKAAEASGTLTVSDLPDFADKGGMIELVPMNGRYRFSVNLVAVKRAELFLSSNLLKLALTVN
jgi:hypothetical protein